MPTVELPLLRPVARGRERGAVHFTVASTVRQIFCCKTAQFCATLRETQTAETPSVGDAVQRSENTRTDKRFGCVSGTNGTIALSSSGGRELDPNASLLSPRRDSFDGFRPVARNATTTTQARDAPQRLF